MQYWFVETVFLLFFDKKNTIVLPKNDFVKLKMAKIQDSVGFFIIILILHIFGEVLSEQRTDVLDNEVIVSSNIEDKSIFKADKTISSSDVSSFEGNNYSSVIENTAENNPTTEISSTVENTTVAGDDHHTSTQNSTIIESSTDFEEPRHVEQNITEHPHVGNHDYEPYDPSHYLSSVHKSSPEEFTINSLSNNLLSITKEMLSFTPRQYRNVSKQARLLELQSLGSNDITELLAERGIVIPPLQGVSCDPSTQFYRTMDGSCNNFLFPCWGKADEPYLRWLPPAYANGIDEPRKRADGHPLPSPREVYQWVSSQFDQNSSTTYAQFSNLIVVWGQLVAHDILLTPTVTVKVWDGKEFHNEAPHCCEPGVTHPDCIPVVLSYDDGIYSRGHCMSIARSAAYVYSPFSCYQLKIGLPREQMNQITSFIDASLVYGASEKQMRKLRENNGQGAKLTMNYFHGTGYLPRKDSPCKSAHASCDSRCFLAGEKRVNENPILAAISIIFVREHNRLVDALRTRGWAEETLFHEVRKIIGALFQHITYKEYLPEVIGTGLMDLLNLTIPTKDYQYSPHINPTLYNVFVSAAFRYGHSMISSKYMRRGRNLEGSPWLSQDFFSMDEFCNPSQDSIATLLYGQADQKAQKVDCLFSKQITNHLFSEHVNGPGLDLFSVNIQRGRDHGLPSYNKWREACGLSKVSDYPDLRAYMPGFVVDRLRTVYGPGGVDEIDLYIAGVSEFPVNGGMLGPTFTCIVSNQFKNLKFGDRFWYENTDHPGAFTKAQILSIQKTTLASLLCRNADIQYIQPKAFHIESFSNHKLDCATILRDTDLDISLWV